ncbi:MAG: M20 family metallopeptidase [Thermoanaerobaculia bacterium]|nr:M20 family metallopeptidase [Thermoanaerobaculia bacterium]
MSEPFPSELEAALEVTDPVALTARLVRIPSHPGIERQEEAVVRSLAAWLTEHGIEPRLDEVAPGRPNLLATLDSGRPGRHLVLCGHTDTVPLNRDDPGAGFSGEVRDGRLLGRGSVDMKGAVAAMAAALVAFEASGALVAGRLTLAAVVDEEMGGSGIDHLVAGGFSADGAVVGEPSENRLLLGHKGLEWLEVRFEGASAHGGTPERGVNAIDAAARFLGLVQSELLPRFAERRHPLLGRPTINAGTIRGGDQPSTVAARCAIAMDRRSVPGEDYASMTAELGELLDRVAAEMPGLEWSIGRVVGGSSSEEKLAFVTPRDHPLAAAVRRAGRMVGGEPPAEGTFPAWTDGGVLAAHGTPVVVLGPGDLSLAHSPREAVPVAELVEAARLYAAAAVVFCGGEDG